MFNFLNHETLFYEICTNYFKRLFTMPLIIFGLNKF